MFMRCLKYSIVLNWNGAAISMCEPSINNHRPVPLPQFVSCKMNKNAWQNSSRLAFENLLVDPYKFFGVSTPQPLHGEREAFDREVDQWIDNHRP